MKGNHGISWKHGIKLEMDIPSSYAGNPVKSIGGLGAKGALPVGLMLRALRSAFGEAQQEPIGCNACGRDCTCNQGAKPKKAGKEVSNQQIIQCLLLFALTPEDELSHTDKIFRKLLHSRWKEVCKKSDIKGCFDKLSTKTVKKASVKYKDFEDFQAKKAKTLKDHREKAPEAATVANIEEAARLAKEKDLSRRVEEADSLMKRIRELLGEAVVEAA